MCPWAAAARSPSAPRASLGASPRCPARPCRRPRVPQPGPVALSTPAAPAVLCVGIRCFEARPGPRRPSISHVIPPQLVQTLNVRRWDCNVFVASRKVTVGNYVRNLCGGGPANACWPCQPAAARTAAGSCGSLVSSALVGRVVLSWLAPTLPRIRYKILPAWCCANQSGIKLSLHAEKAPHRAISGEQGEFYTAHAARAGVLGEFCTARAARAGVLGEFCTEGARRGCCWANNVVLWRSPGASWRAMAAPCCSRALRPGLPGPRRSPGRWPVGVLRHAKPSCGV